MLPVGTPARPVGILGDFYTFMKRYNYAFMKGQDPSCNVRYVLIMNTNTQHKWPYNQPSAGNKLNINVLIDRLTLKIVILNLW